MPTSSAAAQRAYKAGFIGTAGAFFIWGLFPLYLKPLNNVSPVALTAIRNLMGCGVVLLTLGWRGELESVRSALRTPHTRWRLLLTALLINTNWGVYAWGIANGHVIDASLGYFINPLVNVLLGVLVLSERLNRMQWTAVAFAGVGVGYLTWIGGQPPWIALALAFSFGPYGLIRKITPVAALPGLASEMLLFLPIAVAVLIFTQLHAATRIHPEPLTVTLLIFSGPLTAIPLVLFAFGAQRIPYATVGMLQYLGPSLQLIIGILLYREPFAGPRVLGFVFIWLGLLVYASDGVWRSRSNKALLADT